MTEIKMPSAGQTTDEATIVAVHVKVGDTIKRGDVLCEAETDKAVLPVESFAAGTALAVLVHEGDTVTAGTVLVAVGKPGETYGAAPEAAAPAAPAAPTPAAEAPAAPVSPAAAVHMDAAVVVETAPGAAKDTTPGKKMTRVDILCKMERFDALKRAMFDIGITGMTAANVMGCGEQRGKTEGYFRGAKVEASMLPSIQVSIVVCKVPVSLVVETARKVLYTGRIGDGKIFVSDVENVIKVRTGEQGYDALQDEAL